MNNEFKKNKMGTEPVNKLLIKMGIPMIISMMMQAFYNIIDSYFISNMKDASIKNIGDLAVNAMTLSFPIQMLMVALGVGTGVGINALLSKSLGEGNREKASKIAGNSVILGIFASIFFLLFGIFGVDIFVRSQTVDPTIISLSKTYLSICTIFSFGMMLTTTFEKLLQATGKTLCTTTSQILGVITNIILDPIMIFGLFGTPKLGIAGAAYATVIGQVVSMLVNLFFHYKYNSKEFSLNVKYIRFQPKIITEIYRVGLPAILMQALSSVMTYGLNIILGSVSTNIVTAYGIYFKIQQFVFFAVFGMNNAIVPIIGFNYGMRDKKRINDGVKYGLRYILIIMIVGILGLQVFAKQIIGIFALSPETQSLCVLAIRIITPSFILVGTNIAYQGVFQALGCGFYSLFISMLRMIIVVLPLAWIFSKFANAQNLVWLSFPISEIAAFIVTLIMFEKIKKEKISIL